MRRVCIIGVTGSGKSTLAETVAGRLGLRHVDLDALHWEPNWQEAPREVFLARVADALTEEGWVTSGNYSVTRPLTLEQADTIIWLDLSFPLTFWRLLTRTIRRLWTREELWNGNRERLWAQVATRDSIFLWLFKTYGRRQREYPALLARHEQRGCRTFRLRSQGEIDVWLGSLPESARITAPPARGGGSPPRAH